jgi:hypothetical protein
MHRILVQTNNYQKKADWTGYKLYPQNDKFSSLSLPSDFHKTMLKYIHTGHNKVKSLNYFINMTKVKFSLYLRNTLWRYRGEGR